ncbi:MAG: CotH kinase family protein, partial [Planctomycetales bacterium]|nr:CotH kinase family protein [Planctomycetales bacterium]
AANVAPLVIDVQQTPIIPRPGEAVTISAQVRDESAAGVNVTLNWRSNSGPLNSFVMHDDGTDGDLFAGDGVYSANVPPQNDQMIVEYYVAATDATSLTRTWPAATADEGQVTNALYQVIGDFDPDVVWQPGDTPTYYQIMTPADRSAFNGTPHQSDAQFNATFISVDATGVQLRHNVGVRYRGSGSRFANPTNNRINIPSDRPWEGVTALNLNVDTIYNQIAGSLLFRLAGIPTAEASYVRMFSNGVDLRNGQFYAHVEPLNGDFADNRFPLDANGNLYKGRRPNESPPGGLGAGLVYQGEDPLPYGSYIKLTNESEADWSDVIHLTDVLNNTPDENYLEEVAKVIDIDQWLRYFAMHVMVANTEGGLVNGDRQGDDYAMYRGIDDQRFIMVPHDLDSVLNQVNRALFTATGVPALRRLLLHPDLVPRYYEHLLDIADNVFLSPDVEPQLRAVLGNATAEFRIARILDFLKNRAAFVKAEVLRELSFTTAFKPINGLVTTTESAIGVFGEAGYEAQSVRVNGTSVSVDRTTGAWQLGSSITDIVSLNSTWQYLDNGSEPSPTWRTSVFIPDANWKSGPAELGYGDGNEATVVGYGDDPLNRHITTYFRHEFDVADASRYSSLLSQLQVDDGAVVYLNGKEVIRRNMPTDVPIDSTTLATTDVTGGSEAASSIYTLDPADLVTGKNVLAVEVHQFSAQSDDISFNFRL